MIEENTVEANMHGSPRAQKKLLFTDFTPVEEQGGGSPRVDKLPKLAEFDA